jgi:hypothetical protein
MGVPSRTSATTPALDQTFDFQIIPGKVRPFLRRLAEAHPQVLIIAPVQRNPTQTLQDSAQIAEIDADLASELIASGVTTQPVEIVVAVLAASREGASINAAAKASGINYRTAQRIVEAAMEYRQRQLAVVS